jgi:hypothetical protein
MNIIKFKCFLCASESETEHYLNQIYNQYKIDKILLLDIDLVNKPNGIQ